MKYRIIAIISFMLITAYSFYLTVQVNINLIYDIRYKAKEWIEANVKESSSIETYLNINTDSKKYNYYKIDKDYSDIEKRKPDYIILSSIKYNNKNNYIKKSKKLSYETKKSIEEGLPVFLHDLLNEKLNYKIEKTFEHYLYFFDKWPDEKVKQIIIFKRVE